MDTLRQLSGGQLLLLATDKAYAQHFEHSEQSTTDLVFHGSFSMTVNFHALGRYCAQLGGDYHHQETQQSLTTSAFILGERFANLPRTRESLEDYLELFSPGHLFALYNLIANTRQICSLEDILTYLTMSHWDPQVFNTYFDAILEKISSGYAASATVYDLCHGMKRVASQVYVNRKGENTHANIGVFFQTLNKFSDALEFYQLALENGEPDDTTYYNMGLCHVMNNAPEQALYYFQQAIALNRDAVLARGWIAQVQADLAKQREFEAERARTVEKLELPVG